MVKDNVDEFKALEACDSTELFCKWLKSIKENKSIDEYTKDFIDLIITYKEAKDET